MKLITTFHQLLNNKFITASGLKPLDYLGRHVYVSDSRKLTFGRVFNRYREESSEGPRYLLSHHLFEALQEAMGRPLSVADVDLLRDSLGDVGERLDFRTWCGVCAFAERCLPDLPPQQQDPPPWLERADFEMLERRLAGGQVDERLADMLRLIRDR